MTPNIKSGQEITIVPIHNKENFSKNDIVLCRVGNHFYVHLISAVDSKSKKVLISNNHGHQNGWTDFNNVFGIVQK